MAWSPKKAWAFDLIAYASDDLVTISCEVKKDRQDLDEMIEMMQAFLDQPTLNQEPGPSKLRNSYRKVKGLQQLRPAIFWALGPDGYEQVFEVVYPADGDLPSGIKPTKAAALAFPGRLSSTSLTVTPVMAWRKVLA